jgi:DNA-binding NarL/FixJ family response regulator
MELQEIVEVFLLAENRLLREALIRILAKKRDICVVGAAPYSPGALEQIKSAHPGIVLLDSIGPVFSKPGSLRDCATIRGACRYD